MKKTNNTYSISIAGEVLLRWATPVIMLVLVGFGVARFYGYIQPYRRGVIMGGVSIGGVLVSGLTAQEALDRVKQDTADMPRTLLIRALTKSETVDMGELALPTPVTPVVDQAVLIGRGRDWMGNFLLYVAGADGGLDLPLPVRFQVDKLESRFQKMASEIFQEPVNAALDVKNRLVIPHKVGYALDVPASMELVERTLSGYSGGWLDLPVREILPAVLDQEYRKIDFDVPMSTFSTKYNKWARERSSNLQLATSIIDGMELGPGEVFSFNEKVGARTPSAGFKMAPVIIGNRLEPGIGGGVCQVSGTLYNAALLADLEIIERTNHTLASSYVPLGQDATVYYPVLDFRFRNSLDVPIFIYGVAEDGILTFSIYSSVKLDYEVQIWHTLDGVTPYEEERVMDPTLQPGEEVVEEKGIRGFEATTYFTRIYPDGTKETEKLYRDKYHSASKLIRVGPGGAAADPGI